MFTGGGQGSGGQGGQSQLMGMAMSEASQLFDAQSAQGNVSGTKQSAIEQAGKMARMLLSHQPILTFANYHTVQMYMKGQGGGNSGIMSLASKFF